VFIWSLFFLEMKNKKAVFRGIMTKKIDDTQLIKDFQEGKTYAEIALEHKSDMWLITYRLRKLGLKRNKQCQNLFSAEEKKFMKGLITTYRGRRQLFHILVDK